MKPLLAMPGIHYLARSYGWRSLRQRALNARFRSGEWSGFREPPEFVSLVETFARKGRIVVLGCGGNPLGRALDANSYELMVGVDLSSEGIAIALKDAPPRQVFHLCDMMEWKTDQPVDLVVFSESIYYLPLEKICPMLNYWKDNLRPGGRIAVTFVSPSRYEPICEIIRSNFSVELDRPVVPGTERRVMVFN